MLERNERKFGVILSYTAIIVNTLIQLLYTPFLTNCLGQSEYGMYSLVSSIIGYLTVLDLGFSNAIVVYTARYRTQKKEKEMKKLHGMFFFLFCVIGCIAAILGVILSLNVSNIFGTSMSSAELEKTRIMMFILTFNLTITFPFSIYSSIINAYEKFVFQKILTIVSALLKPLLMIPLLFLGYKSITMTIIITVINIAVLLLNYLYCKKKLKVSVKFLGFDKKLFLEIFSYSFFIFLGSIVDKINWSVDQFILGAVSGTVAVSLYAVASQINSLFVSLSASFTGIFLPKITTMVTSKCSDKEISNEFIKAGRIQYYIIFLLVSGFTLLGQEFFRVWVGPEYDTSYYIVLILVIPLSFVIIQNVGLSILQAKNLYKFRSILYIFIAISNIFVSIILAKLYGGIGSAIGTSLALIIGNIIIMNIYYYKKAKINTPKFWTEIIKISIPFIIPITITIILKNIISLHGITYLLVFGSIYTILYSIVAYYLSMNNYEKKLVYSIFRKFKRSQK